MRPSACSAPAGWVPREILDAARVDGAGHLRTLWTIMLPLSLPVLVTFGLLATQDVWNDFLWPLIVVRDPQMQTLPLGLATFLSYFEDTTGALYAFCVMVLVPGLLVFLLAQKHFIQGLTFGATKG